MNIRTSFIIFIVNLFLFINLSTPVLAVDTVRGVQLFNIHCAGCHPNGSNIIRRGKNLQKKALKKYKMDSLEAITSIVANGKNLMSAFQDKLTPQEIEAVAAYVLERADNNWR